MGDEDEVWFTGPSGDRMRYQVPDPSPLAGGQGFVFYAVANGTPVALTLFEQADAHVEAELGARLAIVQTHPHPAIAEVVEVFRGPGLFHAGHQPPEDESDLLYLVTRWVPGTSLRSAAPVEPSTCATLVRSLSAGLTHLHEVCGLVHRDVHPGNVILGPSVPGTLIDLGSLQSEAARDAVPTAGALGFIPPERATGPDDRRSDAWGLGMVAAFALLGHSVARTSRAELVRDLRRCLPSAGRADRVAGLLERMTAPTPEDRPSDLEAWAQDLERALVGRDGRRLVGAAVAATVAVAGFAALALRSDDPPVARSSEHTATTSHADACTAELGEAGPELGPSALERLSAVAHEWPELVPGACAMGPVELFGEALHQPVGDPEMATATHVVVSSPEANVVLTTVEWASYREIAGRQLPENAITFGGYPVSVTRRGGATEIELAHGGLLLGRRDDTQSFWMPEPVRNLWLEHGGASGALGYPMTNPHVSDGGLRQDFEGGHLLLPAEVVVPLDAVLASHLEVVLEPDIRPPIDGSALSEVILRQPTGSAWWISDGRRHWIPDGAIYTCLGGDAAVAIDGISGAALAALPLGPPARCPVVP